MKKPKITLTLVDQKGSRGCHHGHQICDSFDFDTERAGCAPWPCMWPFLTLTFFAMGGSLPTQPDGSILFCCPDVDVINVFRIQVEDG